MVDGLMVDNLWFLPEWQATFLFIEMAGNIFLSILMLKLRSAVSWESFKQEEGKKETHKSSFSRPPPANFTYNHLRFNLSEFNSLSPVCSQSLELWKTRVLSFWLTLQISLWGRCVSTVSSHWNFPNIVSWFWGFQISVSPANLLRGDSLNASHGNPTTPIELSPSSSFCPKILSHILLHYRAFVSFQVN